MAKFRFRTLLEDRIETSSEIRPQADFAANQWRPKEFSSDQQRETRSIGQVGRREKVLNSYNNIWVCVGRRRMIAVTNFPINECLTMTIDVGYRIPVGQKGKKKI